MGEVDLKAERGNRRISAPEVRQLAQQDVPELPQQGEKTSLNPQWLTQGSAYIWNARRSNLVGQDWFTGVPADRQR